MSKSTLMRNRAAAAAQASAIVAESRARRGNATMTLPVATNPPAPVPASVPTPPPAPAPPQPPVPPAQRPEGVSEAEWAALGDPGKTALVRERQRAQTAEQALAAVRANPPAPAPAAPKPADPPKGPDGQPDIAAIVQQAVAAATAPFMEAQAQREAEAAASVIRDAVTTAASVRFHDATDALAQVDLVQLTDGTGRPDQQKITAALDELLTRKPHLGKVVDFRRQAPEGTPIGSTPGHVAPLDDRVKASLARMQQASGVKFVDQA